MSQGPVSDFDLMNALDWRDGIATLPGSHIKFRLSEFGTLEIITDSDSVVTAILPQSGQTPGTDTHSSSLSIPSQVIKIEGKDPEMEKKPAEESSPAVQPTEEQPTAPVQQTIASGSSTCTENERPQRLRRKRKLLMDSGDEEDGLDEEEMNHWHDKMKANLKSRKTSKQTKTAPPTKKKLWNWVSYLEEEKMPAVPLKFFKEHQSFPQSRNNFRCGMKLEGIDPEHPSLYCVLTVAEVQGYRMRLHFDGYPDCYDFWVNADSVDIHPVGWCERTGHKLLPPKGYKDGEFSWPSYLKHCKAQGAPKTVFKSYNTPVTPSGFRVGMKLEAVDRKNPSLLCVATIADIVENRLLIHFDSWDHSYDYWCDASSPYIRPVGYCQESSITLTPPPEYKDPKTFSWEAYLEKTGAQAAPARAFKPLHFDGWSSLYDFWVDVDSPDIHPVGWCAKTGHALQLPPGASDMPAVAGQGCPIAGCTGIGHVRGSRYGTHYTAVGCPYSEVNLNRENFLQDRLSGERPSPVQSATRSRRPGTPSPATDTSDFPQSRGSHTYIRLQIIKQETDGTDCEVSLEQALHQSVFMTSLSSDPGHRIHMCWEQQCYLLPEVSSYTAQSVGKWSADEVAQFVHQLPGCKDQSSVFKDEQIDGEAFLLLTQSDLVKILGLKLGPALKIYNSILMFHTLTQD
ncbi:hypothetical protein XELAEV_18015171mg [Xenopus laevis]|uniref:SAM domain-containing protein n=1 Tax=Xenopus laevis TaxID=8355 RepID=A0A974DHG6_XENLA|nr:hypothetical protein XELAEV_18015171mg [Xenopus laevis]